MYNICGDNKRCIMFVPTGLGIEMVMYSGALIIKLHPTLQCQAAYGIRGIRSASYDYIVASIYKLQNGLGLQVTSKTYIGRKPGELATALRVMEGSG